MDRTIRYLTRHYHRRDETVAQVLAVLERYQGLLNPEQSDFTYDDGRVELLLSLTGVLPIAVGSNTYHCPVVFWLPLDFPTHPPMVFVIPSEALAIRKGKNVDSSGKVAAPYLEQWARKSEGRSLLTLIDELVPIFSARYPVTAVQPKPAAARPPPPPAPPATASQNYNPVISSARSPPPRPPPPTGSSAPGSSSAAGGEATPPRPPLPAQMTGGGRPGSLIMDMARRPASVGGVEGIGPGGPPPRPPLPPGSGTVAPGGPPRAVSLPVSPPPGYRPSPPPPMPPYGSAAPQRSSTLAFASSPPQPPPPPQPPTRPRLPPAFSSPQAQPPAPSPPSMPTSQPPPPVGEMPLPGAVSPLQSQQPVSAPPSNDQHPLPPRTQFEAPPHQRDSHPPPPPSQPHPQPHRPYSPGTSTVRSYSPAPSSIAAHDPQPQPPTRRPTQFGRDPHQRHLSYGSQDSYVSAPPTSSKWASHDAQVREQVRERERDMERSYSPAHSTVRSYSPPSRMPDPVPDHYSPSSASRHPRSRPPQAPVEPDPSVRAYSPAPASVAHPYSPQPVHAQSPSHRDRDRTRSYGSPALAPAPPPWARAAPVSSSASIATASEYDYPVSSAEYGAYLPPSSSAVSISIAGESPSRRDSFGSEVVPGMDALSIAGRDGIRRTEGANDGQPRMPAMPPAHHASSRPPHSSTTASYQPRHPHTQYSHNHHIYTNSENSAFDPVIEPRGHPHGRQDSLEPAQQPYYESPPPPLAPYAPRQQPQQPPSVLPSPPPASFAPPRAVIGHGSPSSSSAASRPVRSVRTAKSAKPTVNILDAADDDFISPSSATPSSPSDLAAPSSLPSIPASVSGTPNPSLPPPVPPNPSLLALRTRVHSKLTSSLASLHSHLATTSLEPLSLMHSDLLKAAPAIEDEMARLRAVRDVCENVRDRYKALVEEGERRMAEYERRGEGVEVDEIVCGSTVVYTQLLDLVAEDAALEDTIYALGRGLHSGTANIDLDQFLKRVRALAREQFIKRATVNKILLGLAIRRERNQQRSLDAGSGGDSAAGSRKGSGSAGRGTPSVET
ncbi:hypothetical protein JCM1841_006319 [Sporobolomyces salmonicolor]